MNKKGFTLVEMLVIIIFITLVALMAVPAITNSLKKGEDNKYQLFLEDIYLATEAYLQKYSDDYPELKNAGGTAHIYMTDLVDEKLVSTNLVNPKYERDGEYINRKIANCDDNTCVVDDYTIIVTKNDDNTYSYELRNEIVE